MTSVSLYNPLCSDCRRPMGEMTKDEFEFLVLSTGGMGKCFDCEPVLASHRPEIFKNLLESDLLDIGDIGLQVRDWKLKVIGSSRSHAHERTRARGLSSSTKVNGSSHNPIVFSNGIEVKMCPVCRGMGAYQEFGDKVVCGECFGDTWVEVAIFLPVWLVGLGVVSG